jgi:hypothetical protein
VANAVYALPLAFAVFLLTSVASRGGWALVPAGLLLSWLFLNARALWIAPKEACNRIVSALFSFSDYVSWPSRHRGEGDEAA